jgi:hypothetical protein
MPRFTEEQLETIEGLENGITTILRYISRLLRGEEMDRPTRGQPIIWRQQTEDEKKTIHLKVEALQMDIAQYKRKLEHILGIAESHLPTVNLKGDIVSGIKEALGIHDPAPYYLPNKINRDTGRLQNINRVPPSKTWSIAELEHYNQKGHVNYRVKNTQRKRLPTVFDPKLPILGLERTPPTTSYSKPGMHASVERTHQPSQMPTSFLVA